MKKIKIDTSNKTIENSISELEMSMLAKRINSKISTDSRRKRPRNPQEKEILLRWEKERDGIKIGII
ncbi:hypothetical protein ACFP65_09620 [Marinilactibacillus sp. GCM10026970]|uniref:hypothetical protein n=1 Tax=unclassified Marinilactibacillus TaxID=2632303 RepID=UPI001CE42A20|nr:hypothetical protein [Marinilactibacillus sp. Marseille-P9653]